MSVEWGKIVENINWTLLFGVINFGFLLYILKRLLFKPALEFLDRRRELIAARMDAARQSEKQAQDLASQRETELQQARGYAQDVLDDARREAERILASARDEAKTDASRIVADGKLRLEQERDQMIRDLREAYAQIAVLGAQRVLDREIRVEDHQRLLEKLLEEVEEDALRVEL